MRTHDDQNAPPIPEKARHRNVHELAGRITAAVASGKMDELDAVIDPECWFWYSYEPVRKSWATVRQTLQGLADTVASMSYEEVRVTELQDGWLQQHYLRMMFKNGQEKKTHAALIFRLNRNGLVSSMEEYLNPADL